MPPPPKPLMDELTLKPEPNEAENLLEKGIKKKRRQLSQEEKEKAIFERWLCRRIEGEK
jgi:hypothetical protein